MLLLLLGGLMGGCYTREVSSTWDSLREVADPKPVAGGADRPERAPRGWAIKLESFDGPDRLKSAYHLAAAVRGSGQVADVWFADAGDATHVYVGRWRRRGDTEIRPMLERVRAVRLEDGRSFAHAELTPLGAGRERVGRYDLSQHTGYRSLLVAIYDRNLGENFRLAAEEHAQRIRDAGRATAYYYHGPNQSMVTVNLYTINDFVAIDGVDHYGPSIEAMQEKFPFILRNGEKIKSEAVPTEEGFEPTVIVRVH